MAKIADFGLSRGEEVYVKKTMVSAGGRHTVSANSRHKLFVGKGSLFSTYSMSTLMSWIKAVISFYCNDCFSALIAHILKTAAKRLISITRKQKDVYEQIFA